MKDRPAGTNPPSDPDDIFNDALALDGDERSGFLDRACANNAELRREIEEMLEFADGHPELTRPPEDFDIPKKLGKYELLSELGRGAMGIVFKALDTQLGRTVALKVLPDRLASDEKSLERFKREARLLASLNDERIATLHSLEEDGGIHFLTMEFVEGRTLAELIAEDNVGVEVTLNYCYQIACALERAHGEGIIHRDLKPANIMVTHDGQVTILDFGIAKGLGTPLGEQSALDTQAVDETASLGTPAYMSPEQMLGNAIDHRADLWAFGCILFECLSFKMAYDTLTLSSHAAESNWGRPDLSLLPKGTPGDLVRLIKRCLDPDTEQRLGSSREARMILEGILEQKAVRWRRITFFVVAAAIAAVAGGAYLLRQSGDTGFADVPNTGDSTTVVISTDPPGALVSLGGVILGTTPLERLVPSGTTELKIEQAGYYSIHDTLALQGSEPFRTNFVLSRLTGTLAITSDPPGARIIVDNEDTEFLTPGTIEGLFVDNTYGIALHLKGYTNGHQVVRVLQDSTVAWHHKFSRAGRPLTVTSVPAGATIYLDNEHMGMTITRLDWVAEGEHVLELRKEGYRSTRREIRIPIEDDLINWTLQPLPPGILVIHITRNYGHVYIDGQLHKSGTTYYSAELTSGIHRIELRHPQAASFDTTITVSPADTIHIRHAFEIQEIGQ